MKRFKAIIPALISLGMTAEPIPPAALQQSCSPSDRLVLLNRVQQVEKELDVAIRCDAKISADLTRECQQICQKLSLDDCFVGFETSKNPKITRAVCTGCNISPALITINNKLTTIDSLLTQIEGDLSDISCGSGTCTYIDPDGTVIQEGGTYCLKSSTQDYTTGYIGTVPAVTVDSEDVTLDLNGHTIFAGSSQPGVRVKKGRVTVKNGRIVRTTNDDGHGLQVESDSGTTLSDITISDVILTGNDSSSSYSGLLLKNVNRTVVDEVTADKNGQDGIRVESTNTDAGTGIVIQESRARSNQSAGFYLQCANTESKDGVVIQSCIALTNATGFSIDNSSSTTTQDVLLKSCISLSNSSKGFSATNDDAAIQFINNIARGNGAGTSDNYQNVNSTYTALTALGTAPFWANISL